MASSDSSGPCCESRQTTVESREETQLFLRKDDQQQGTRAMVGSHVENDPNGTLKAEPPAVTVEWFAT